MIYIHGRLVARTVPFLSKNTMAGRENVASLNISRMSITADGLLIILVRNLTYTIQQYKADIITRC